MYLYKAVCFDRFSGYSENKLAQDFLIKEIARTWSSSCKNLHQLISYNEHVKGVLSLKMKGQRILVLGNPENKIFCQ